MSKTATRKVQIKHKRKTITLADENFAAYIAREYPNEGGKDAAFKDRQLFVKNLGILLSQTRNDIISASLDKDEIVTVTFKGGYKKRVNVNMDSYSAIIKDVYTHAL